jgi:hypothetical protein
MLKSILKTGITSLKRYKAFSIIDILGFVISISIFTLIILFVLKEYSLVIIILLMIIEHFQNKKGESNVKKLSENCPKKFD